MAILIVGGSSGLGAQLAWLYALDDKEVYATCRRKTPPAEFTDGRKPLENIHWVTEIDRLNAYVGEHLVQSIVHQVEDMSPSATSVHLFDTVIITAPYSAPEDPVVSEADNELELELDHDNDRISWAKQHIMYTTAAVAPVFIINELVDAKMLAPGAKVVLVSSEAGSLTLRHPSEGRGNYSHHASKAALNMVGRMLSQELKEQGYIVVIAHPGFKRRTMARDSGGAERPREDLGGHVTPTLAAATLIEWTKGLTMEHSGQFWAPRGNRDIETWQAVMGSSDDGITDKPIQLPW
ncbi:hypothetical protein GE09DRAFT_1130495 [Coniochaeta sp. 2T2.1]|nr:hypothetical protein GE09DRAFT_1130495 [Coniochaeta sp. 2T2.1]